MGTERDDISTVRVGLMGFGYWGRNLARNIAASPTTELVAVCDPDERVLQSAASALPSVSVARTQSEMLERTDIDAVVIATPAATHADVAVSALAAGKHIMVEKPLALSVADAEEIVDAGARAGRIVMVGHTFLYAPPVRRLRRYVDEGELGDVQYIYSQRLSLGRIRRDCNALWNFAPHDISVMLYLTGELPTEVSARGFSFISQTVEDVYFGSVSFASGVGGNFHVSWIDPRKSRLLTVVGNRKMAVYDDVSVDQKIQLFDAGVAVASDSTGEYESLGEFQWKTRSGDIVIPNIAMTEPLLLEMEAFGEACVTGVAPLADGRHGADVVRILSAAEESAHQHGAPVAIDWRHAAGGARVSLAVTG